MTSLRVGPLKIKAQIFCGDELAMGPGKADLLDAIDRTGSISAAGRLLGMSYRRTWLLVDAMNRCWRDRLVDTVAGGARNRGARLTATGRVVLDGFRAMENQLARTAAPTGKQSWIALLKDNPRPAGPPEPPHE